MKTPECPRCAEEPTGQEERRYRGGVSGYNSKSEASQLNKPAVFDRDSDGNLWYICPVCGLLWVPATGRRASGVGLDDDVVYGKANTKRGAD